MSLSEIKEWLGVAQAVGTVGIALLLLYLRQAFASKGQVEHLESQMADIKVRLVKIEAEVEAIPSGEEMRGMRETLAEVKAVCLAQGAMLQTIHNHLLGRNR